MSAIQIAALIISCIGVALSLTSIVCLLVMHPESFKRDKRDADADNSNNKASNRDR